MPTAKRRIRPPNNHFVPVEAATMTAVGPSELPMMPMVPFINQAKNSSFRVMGSMYSPSLYTRILPEATSSIRMTLPSGA